MPEGLSLDAWAQTLPTRLQPLLIGGDNEGDITALLTEVAAKKAANYQQAWRALIDHLRTRRGRILEEEAGGHPNAKVLGGICDAAEEIRPDHRSRLLRQMGIEVRPVLDRAIERVCCLKTGSAPEVLNSDIVRIYLQGLYDGIGVASRVIDHIVAVLEGQDSEEDRFLGAQLKQRPTSTAARSLTARGVKLRDPREVAREVGIQPSDPRKLGRKGRRARLLELAALSPFRREETRIERAGLADWPYAGRRKDVADWRGHHPYFSSVAAANMGRHLTSAGKPWEYRSRYEIIDVPPEMANRFGSPRTIGFEPDFTIIEEGAEHHIVLISDRRHRGGPGTTQERSNRLDMIRRLRPDWVIEDVPIGPLRTNGLENEFKYEHKGGKTTRAPGRNIMTEPDRFLLEDDQCQCAACRINRGQPAVEKDPMWRGRPMF